MSLPTFHNGIIDFRDEPELKMGEDLRRLGFSLDEVFDYDTQKKKAYAHFNIAQGGTRTVFSKWHRNIVIPSDVHVKYDGNWVTVTAEVSFDGLDWRCDIYDPLHRTNIRLDEDELKQAKTIEIFGTKEYSDLKQYRKEQS